MNATPKLAILLVASILMLPMAALGVVSMVGAIESDPPQAKSPKSAAVREKPRSRSSEQVYQRPPSIPRTAPEPPALAETPVASKTPAEDDTIPVETPREPPSRETPYGLPVTTLSALERALTLVLLETPSEAPPPPARREPPVASESPIKLPASPMETPPEPPALLDPSWDALFQDLPVEKQEPPVIRPAPIAEIYQSDEVPQGFINAELMERVFPAVVRVSTPNGRGTGCIVGHDARHAYVLTCDHCCGDDGSSAISVEYYLDCSRSETVPGKVVARDADADLALVEAPRSNSDAGLPIPAFSNLPSASHVLVVGHPDGNRGAFVAEPGTNWAKPIPWWGVRKTSFGGQSGSPVIGAGMLVGIWCGSRSRPGDGREGVCASLWSIDRFLAKAGYHTLVHSPTDRQVKQDPADRAQESLKRTRSLATSVKELEERRALLMSRCKRERNR